MSKTRSQVKQSIEIKIIIINMLQLQVLQENCVNKIVGHILHCFKLRQNEPLSDLILKNSHRSKQRQNAPIYSILNFKIFSTVPTFKKKKFRREDPQPDHFPILSKLYFALATPLVTDFARMQPRWLKLPNILDGTDLLFQVRVSGCSVLWLITSISTTNYC